MKTYLCRLIVAGKIREIGVAAAFDDDDLFWLLDEFADPYAYEFCLARAGDAVFFPVEQYDESKEPGLVLVGETPDPPNNDVFSELTELAEKDLIGPFTSENTSWPQERRRVWRRFVASADNFFKPHVVPITAANDAP